MENIDFDFTQQELYIKNFPDAEKVIKLQGSKAQELADIALCRSDLFQAREYLLASKKEEKGSVVQSALWKMAIICFLKGFGKNNARTLRLDILQILPGDTMGHTVYSYFKDVRDKNVAHDDSPISQCLVAAILNKADSSHKIAKIITTNFHGLLNEEGNVSNLENLIEKTLEYVERRYEELCKEITTDLEGMSHEQLVKMEVLIYKVPLASEVSKNRDKLLS